MVPTFLKCSPISNSTKILSVYLEFLMRTDRRTDIVTLIDIPKGRKHKLKRLKRRYKTRIHDKNFPVHFQIPGPHNKIVLYSKPAIRPLKEEAICANSPQAPPCKKLWRNIRFDSVVEEVVPSFPSVLLHYWQINQEQAGGVG